MEVNVQRRSLSYHQTHNQSWQHIVIEASDWSINIGFKVDQGRYDPLKIWCWLMSVTLQSLCAAMIDCEFDEMHWNWQASLAVHGTEPISGLQIIRTVWSEVVAQWVKNDHFSSWRWTHGHQIVFESYSKDLLHGAGIYSMLNLSHINSLSNNVWHSWINGMIYGKKACIVTMEAWKSIVF